MSYIFHVLSDTITRHGQPTDIPDTVRTAVVCPGSSAAIDNYNREQGYQKMDRVVNKDTAGMNAGCNEHE